MAKIVIAGAADCPYYARIELLADSLAKNLPDFKLHKIVKQPNDWESWLSETCNSKGWMHKKSPIVWRELVDRGGKGLLIGGANEFQEYAFQYYNLKSSQTSDDMKKIGSENLKTKIEIDEEEREFLESIKPINVCITNASSSVCYSMMEAIAKGEALGLDTDIDVRLLDTEDNMEMLEGVRMEVFDLACPLLRGITTTTNLTDAVKDCSLVIILDEIEKGEEETKDDWLKRNREHFLQYSGAINDHACSDVKVLLAGCGPVNFNAYMMVENMPNVPKQNVVAMSRIVENHAKAILSERLRVNSSNVVDVVVWGHSSNKYFLDLSRSRVHRYDGAIWGPPSFSLPVMEMVHDDKWLQAEFLDVLEKRRATVEAALNHRASASHAFSIVSLISHWWTGSPSGQLFSLGVQSEGWYGVPDGLFFSYPVTFDPSGKWTVIEGIELSEENKEKFEETIKDLVSEKEVIYPPPRLPTPEAEPEPAIPDTNTNNSNITTDPSANPPTLERITEDQEGEEQAAAGTPRSQRSLGTPRSQGTPKAGTPRSQTPQSTKDSPRPE